MPPIDPQTQELLVTMLLMAAVLFLVAGGIQVVLVFRRRMTASDADPEVEMGDAFRDAYEAGQIDTSEYNRIKESLGRAPETPPGQTRRPAKPASQPVPPSSPVPEGECPSSLDEDSGATEPGPDDRAEEEHRGI